MEADDCEVLIPRRFDDLHLKELIPRADVIITARAPISDALIHSAVNLRLIAMPSTGVDNVDIAAAVANDVAITNVPRVRGQAVAEHAFFMLLYLVRHGWLRGDPRWEMTPAHQLSGMNLGIIGFGDVGTRVAEIGRGFQMSLLVSSRSQPPTSSAGQTDTRFVTLEQLLSESDVVVLCAPLTEQTRGMMDVQQFSSMKPSANFINVSRGPLVVTKALFSIMDEGHLHGTGLDVTDPEPLPSDHGLRSLPNVLISPHNAGRTETSQRMALERMRENIQSFLRGDIPRDRVPTS